MPRLALLGVLAEEGWTSIDLAQERLLRNAPAELAAELRPELVRPAMTRRFQRLPLVGELHAAYTADRLLNRMRDYPRYLSGRAAEFDLFHVCDHSYAQLVHVVPPERTGVLCHDLDMFRCLLEPEKDPRSFLFRAMSRRILRGLRKAAIVFHTTRAVRREIERFGLVEPARLVEAPNGVSAAFSPNGTDDGAAAEALGPAYREPFLLHVGSCIPRKRIDVLLGTFAAIRKNRPSLRLVQFGGTWSPEQRGLIARLGLGGSLRQLSGRDEAFAAALYRRAAATLQTSEGEGFGLPVAEALACGGAVVASDIPALREVGGPGAVYCPVGDVPAWAEAVERVLADPRSAPAVETRLAQARRFSWTRHAEIIFSAYRRLLQ